MSYLERISAGISNIVYHYTSLWNAGKILKEDQFNLTFITGSDDTHKPESKFYYLSTTRSRLGNYHAGSYIGVLFKLDGRKLQANYVGNPVDYWGREFRNAQPTANEMEDRIWSDKPEIKPATKYIDEIHVFYDTKFSKDPKGLRDLLIQAKRKNIPYYVYTDRKAANLLDTRKAVKLEDLDLKVEPKTPHGFMARDSVAPWVEFYEKDRKEYLSDDAKGMLRWGFRSLKSFKTALHNSKKGTPSLHKLVKILKKNKWDINEYYTHIRDKWTNQVVSFLSKVLAAKEYDDNEIGTGKHALTTDDSGKFWGNEGAGAVFYAKSTKRCFRWERTT